MVRMAIGMTELHHRRFLGERSNNGFKVSVGPGQPDLEHIGPAQPGCPVGNRVTRCHAACGHQPEVGFVLAGHRAANVRRGADGNRAQVSRTQRGVVTEVGECEPSSEPFWGWGWPLKLQRQKSSLLPLRNLACNRPEPALRGLLDAELHFSRAQRERGRRLHVS